MIRTFVLLIAIMTLAAVKPMAGQQPCGMAPAQDALSKAASQYLSTLDEQRISPARRNALRIFYSPCDFQLAWTAKGALTPQARDIMIAMGQAAMKGLRPEDYGFSWWGCRVSATEIPCERREQELAQFDVDLTVAVMRFATDLRYGRARPHVEKAGYAELPQPVFIADFVRSHIVGAEDVPLAIRELEPHHPGYLRAQRALDEMGSMLKSEPDVIVPLDAQQTHTGDRSQASLALSQRLRQLGFLPVSSSPESDQILGPTIGSALLRFQQLRGLTPTGTVDSATLKALNVPLQRRAEQLSMTLERWRWLPHDFVEPPIVINIPEFRLRAYDRDGNVQFSMAVIVGRAGNRKTPILSATMNEVIFHPYWNVPPSIQAHEIGPILSRNPSYLSQHGFEVIDRSGRVLDNTSIGARQKVIHGEARIRQVPGAQNALGYMKFSFPNAFNIYMHGTPQVSLFTKTKRDFSHGCIRVEDPEHLAQWVLRGQPPWTVEKIAAAIANPATSTLHLAQPVPVLIVYGTGIAAEDDTVRFFEDIYGYDAELRAQLDQISASRTQEDRLPWSALNKK